MYRVFSQCFLMNSNKYELTSGEFVYILGQRLVHMRVHNRLLQRHRYKERAWKTIFSGPSIHQLMHLINSIVISGLPITKVINERELQDSSSLALKCLSLFQPQIGKMIHCHAKQKNRVNKCLFSALLNFKRLTQLLDSHAICITPKQLSKSFEYLLKTNNTWKHFCFNKNQFSCYNLN